MYKFFLAKYAKVVLIVYACLFLFRLFEIVGVFYNYGFDIQVLVLESKGFFLDILLAGTFLIGYALIYLLLAGIKPTILKPVNLSLLVVFTIISYFIIGYFLYQLIPLDIFLFQYSFSEVFLTIKTSSTNFTLAIAGLIFVLILVLFSALLLNRIILKPIILKTIYCFVIASIPLYFLVQYMGKHKIDKFTENKPLYFIGASIKYVAKTKTDEKVNSSKFETMYPQKTFVSRQFPLLHKIERDKGFSSYFNKFSQSPNIVLLIVEGLNDDFIHEYKGVMLMPFLNELKNKSLYWNRCFTLGERSFAAVPSILGGLPYGEKGFTLQQRLPRHLSLVSVLNANNYYTTFYYGQGAWFHQKNRFFNYNDIDLIFDNSKFAGNYEKIIVGDDHFFWGYNDKDLFRQSLKVIDTLNQTKRFDIYFTGTSHSPFAITDETYYNNRLKKLAAKPYNDFFNTYSKYLKTVLFVDDALNEFITEYKKRDDFENTIFIITGDHPMTEIPITNSLKRYHVPLIIYSDKLKQRHVFSQTVSHLDVSESVYDLLAEYSLNVPSVSTSLGYKLVSTDTAPTKPLAFMNDNREVVDFLWGNYYLAGGQLFSVDTTLNLIEIENDSIKMRLADNLSEFNKTSRYVAENDNIISSSLFCQQLKYLNIFETKSTQPINLLSEYYNLTDNIPIRNINFIFDGSLTLSAKKTENCVIVYQISNSADSLLFWKEFGVNKQSVTQWHFPISMQNTSDTTLYFKSFIWNKNKTELVIDDVNILLYAPSNQK